MSGLVSYRPPEGLRAVISGLGAVRERLAEELTALGLARPMIVCGPNVGALPLVALVAGAAGRPCEVFRGSQAHTPIPSIDAGAAAAKAAGADGLVALGGSSAVDCAKGIGVLLASGLGSVRALQAFHFTALAAQAAETEARPFPVVCIPTTLSAAEFQPFFGARDPDSRRKEPYAERGLISRTVFLDGEAAVSTPRSLWAETGVKALDDAFSRYCNAEVEEPAADAVQAQAIAGLMQGLAAGARGGAAERQANLVDVWLTTHPLPRHRPAVRKAWFSAVFRHALGGAAEAPHGAASCVALPEALRFHAATWDRQAKLAAALDLDPGPAGEAPLAAPVARLLAGLGVPTRIRDLGVERAALDRVVENMVFEQPGLGAPVAIRAACERLW